MATPRRQLIRPNPVPTPPSPQTQQRLQRLRQRLQESRAFLGRWQTRLRRAFNTVDKLQRLIARLERQIRKTEEA